MFKNKTKHTYKKRTQVKFSRRILRELAFTENYVTQRISMSLYRPQLKKENIFAHSLLQGN